MIKSMTGYGREKRLVGTRDILAEVKSVNSRFLDVTVKLPRVYSVLEERARMLVSSFVTRAKVELYISVDNIAGDKIELTLNREYLDSFLAALETIAREYGICQAPSMEMILGRPEVFSSKRADEDFDALWEDIAPVVTQAFCRYNEMREREGSNLRKDLLSRIDTIEAIARKLAEKAPEAIAANNERLKARVTELLGDTKVDEQRLLTECAALADRQDITEELTRLFSHIMQFRTILDEDAPVGRKLDFLVQELNREVNTCGSKANSIDLSSLVIDAKCELEKIREQIQNLE